MGNAGAGEPFGDDADHDSEHGSPAVEEFNALELIHVDVASCSVLKPRIAGLAWLHDLINGLLRIVNPLIAIAALLISTP